MDRTMHQALSSIERKKAEIDRLEADFIWTDFFNYCKLFYAKGGVYGDEVDATDKEIELAMLDILDDKEYEFEGDSWDRERVRSCIENRRKQYVRCHIPLIVPQGDIKFEIERSIIIDWSNVFAFDNQCEHSAWNNSSHRRLVFLIDLHRSIVNWPAYE